MKQMLRFFMLGFALVFPVLVLAQDGALPTPVVSEEMMTKPFAEWQLNLTTVLLASMILGRVVASIKKGGGLRGIFAGIWGGTNTPSD